MRIKWERRLLQGQQVGVAVRPEEIGRKMTPRGSHRLTAPTPSVMYTVFPASLCSHDNLTTALKCEVTSTGCSLKSVHLVTKIRMPGVPKPSFGVLALPLTQQGPGPVSQAPPSAVLPSQSGPNSGSPGLRFSQY